MAEAGRRSARECSCRATPAAVGRTRRGDSGHAACGPSIRRSPPSIPPDAIIRVSAACICGWDLLPSRGIAKKQTPAGHEYCGTVEKPGQVARGESA
ncbi:MAG TPA: alcohol dehydrogenase catalytic domain-containing protein [Dehalococcoidia bacterium]|nr:alcohol dehydrogenase catalytic domain-containing protein [Dehalococcoidia bacterium]